MHTHWRLSVLAGLAALFLSSTCAPAEDHTLKIVYPFAAGGTGDATTCSTPNPVQAPQS